MIRKFRIHFQNFALQSQARFSIIFDSSKPQQELAQEAQVAMHYLAEICKNDDQIPLIYRLINLKVDCVDSAILQKKRKLFIGGVPIDSAVFDQERVLNVTADINKNISQYKGLFCFHPTTIVTTSIFQHINNFKNKKSLIYGPFGISKTISIMLYHHLSSDINRYLYLTSNQKRSSFKQNWKNKKMKIPKKLFYWSIKLDQKQKNLMRILQRQCPQLGIEQNFRKVENLVQKIMQAYNQKQISCSVVIDQINKIDSVYRKYNKQILENKPQTEKTKKLANLASQAEIYSWSVRSIATYCNGTYFYNSSTNIQDELLDCRKNTNQDLLYLDLDDHTEIYRKRIEYTQNLNKQVGKEEIDLIIAKQVLHRIPSGTITKLWTEGSGKQENVEIYQQKILKEEITKIRGNRYWEFYVRPLTIYKCVSQSKKINFSSKNQLIDSISRVVIQLKEQSKKFLLSKLQQFLVKIQRQQAAFNIYLIALQRIREDESNWSKPVYISSQQLKEMDIENFDPRLDLDLQLFFQTDNGYQMYLTIEQYLQILNQQKISSIIHSQSLRSIKSHFKKSNPTLFSILLQQTFISYIKIHFKSIVIDLWPNKVWQKIRFKNIATFIQLNKLTKTSQKSVASHLEKTIQVCKNPKQLNLDYVFGFPVKKGQKQQTGNSVSIDMLMMKVNEKNQMTIYSFDFATSKTVSNLQKKWGQSKVSELIEKSKLQIQEEKAQVKIGQSQKFWGVQQLYWTHYIVISPQMITKIKKPEYQKQKVLINSIIQQKQIIPKYLSKIITFEQIQIVEGDKSFYRSAYEKGVELMKNSREVNIEQQMFKDI